MNLINLIRHHLFIDKSNFSNTSIEAKIEFASKFSSAAYCPKEDVEKWTCGPKCFTASDDFVTHVVDDSSGVLFYYGTSKKMRLNVLAFCGTKSIINYLSDVKISKSSPPWLNDDSLVHTGFLDIYLKLREKIQASLAYFSNFDQDSFLVTGHSLGGAMVTILSSDSIVYDRKAPLFISFGSPRVGNYIFTKSVPENIRVINERDIIPHLPLSGTGYLHPNREYWLKNRKLIKCKSLNMEEDPDCSNSLLIYSYFDHLFFGNVFFSPICR